MIFFFITLAVLCLYKVSFPNKRQEKVLNGASYFNDYLSIEKTNSIKGIFILTVFLSHLLGYIDLSSNAFDKSYTYVLDILGQSMVAPFLFYSGFGIMLSINKKGKKYVNEIPKKRFLKVLLHFDIAVMIFVFIQLVIGKTFPLKTIFLSLTAWNSVGNSNWYIFVVLCLYITTFLSFVLSGENLNFGFILSIFFSIALILLLKHHKELWWYDTVLCYNLGIGYYLFREQIEKILFKNKVNYYIALLLLFITWYCTYSILKGIVYTLIRHLAFVSLIVLLTMKIGIKNKVLQFFGKHLFSLYILQRIPMILLSHFGLSNKFAFACLSFVITVMLAVPFDMLLKRIDAVLFRNKNKQKNPL